MDKSQLREKDDCEEKSGFISAHSPVYRLSPYMEYNVSVLSVSFFFKIKFIHKLPHEQGT